MTVVVALAIVALVSLHSGQADQEGDGTTLREIAQTCQTTHQAIQSLLAATGQNQTPPPTNYALPICLQGQFSDRTQKGEKGDTGEVGRIGKAGPQGPKGANGDDGAVGIQGRKGEKGDTGPTGAKGNQGICKEPTPGIPHPDFQSSWVNLNSQAEADSFMTVRHNLGELPVRVKVLVRALGGQNDGYMFEGVGATSADDDDEATRYGGVAFSYNENEVRIWAPDGFNDLENGCIISTGGPLWGGKYDQCTHSAEVKVQAWLPLTFPCPDIVTGWFEFRSQDGVNSFKEVEHNLGERPSLVVVQYKAIDAGPDFEGFVYEGIGAAQCDDDRAWANHGGLVYATDSWSVRLWAPSKHNSSYEDANYAGSIINVKDGWGGETFSLQKHVASVKISIWKRHIPEPDFQTDWLMQMGQGSGINPFREIRLPSVIQPDLVQVEVQALDGPNQGFVFYGTGVQQAHPDYNYGGVAFGYSNSTIRLWSPSSSSGAIVNVIDGWGGEVNVQSSKVATVTVKVWQTYGGHNDVSCTTSTINP